MANYMGEAMDMFNKVAKVAKQVALNLSEIEIKVEEATNNEPWGPHGAVMNEIADAAYDSEKYKDIMGVLARRLQDKGDNWRHVYKTLLLLEHMLKNGPMKVVHELRNNIGLIESLTSFQYKDPKGKDQGINVRNRAKTLAELCRNMERIKEEREKAKENRNKYGGVSARDMQSGGGAFRSTATGFGNAATGSRYEDKYDSYDRYDSGSRYDSYQSGGGGGGKGRAGFSASGTAGSGFRTEDRYEPPKAPAISSSSGNSASAEDAALPDPGTGKKKLSATKVDPNIANTFAKMTVTAPAATAARAPVPAASAAAANNGDSWDAFASPAAPTPAAAAAASPADGWDAFASSSSAPAQQQQADSWDAFASASAPAAAPAPAAPAAPQDPFAALSAPAPASGGATDLFASMTTTAPSADPFATAAPSTDPFASMATPAPAAPAQAAEAKAPSSAPLPEDLFGAPQKPPAVQTPNMMGSMGMGMGMPPQQPGMMQGGMGMPQQQMQPGMGMGMGMGGMPPQQMMQPNMMMGGGGMMGGMPQQQMMPPPGMMMGAGMMGGMQQQQMMMGGGMGMGGMGMPQQQAQRQPHSLMGGSQGQVPKNNSNIVMSSTAAAKKDPFADLVGL